jgi:tRNA threonylcarbamoyladenosine dehydratase
MSTAATPRRFAGIARLYGGAGAVDISAAHVVVVGLGGVGSWAAEALARSGVSEFTLIDMDHVAESNINRQIHATENTLGQAKVLAMRERILQFHPTAIIHTIDDFLTAENASTLLPASANMVVDACDQVRAKAAMAAWAQSQGKGCVMSGAAGGKVAPQLMEVADIAEVTHDRLLAAVRGRLRRDYGFALKGKMNVPCVFSREAVRINDDCDPEAKLACAGYGSSVAVTASFGMALASLALAYLANTTEKTEQQSSKKT